MFLTKNPTRNLFFTGKGGVGKTTMACASAVQLADEGRRVLLVSTDPASNLHDVLATQPGHEPTPVNGIENLWAMNIDPAEAARQYRERTIAPYRETLPAAAIQSMEEQLSGSCTLEIAAFDEFTRLLADDLLVEQYDHIVFDTAPTGHTLRLLALPSAWTKFMETSTTGTSCLGPLAGLKSQQAIYRKSMEALKNPSHTTLILVTRPEVSALAEAERTSTELQQLDVKNQTLIINGMFVSHSNQDKFANALEQRCQTALESIPTQLKRLPSMIVPLFNSNVLGIDRLRNIGNTSPQEVDAAEQIIPPISYSVGLNDLIDEIAATGRGVVMTMGKGGVGKTTIAAAVAVTLADRGHKVVLSTTDPAAHLSETLNRSQLPGLTVARIDPEQEVARYRTEVMATAGAGLDEEGKRLLEEDLRSPCTEEIAIFRAFARTVSECENQFVVLDTAPTGHTILLLDSALAYHREVTRQAAEMPDYVQQLLPRLRNPELTRLLIATLPEATPVHEATQLQADLKRAGIQTYAWVVNQSFLPHDVSDRTLRQRQLNEIPYIQEIAEELACRMTVLPWQKVSPTGAEGLRHLLAEPVSVDH